MTDQPGIPPPEFELRQLSVAAVLGLWDQLYPWVEQVRRKTRAPWRAEDVYVELKEHRAISYLPILNGNPVGLLVLVDQTDPITRHRKLAMWIAYSTHPAAVDLTLDRVEFMAKQAGFFSVSGMSPRKGWLRKLRSRGYNLVAYHFEKRVI